MTTYASWQDDPTIQADQAAVEAANAAVVAQTGTGAGGAAGSGYQSAAAQAVAAEQALQQAEQPYMGQIMAGLQAQFGVGGGGASGGATGGGTAAAAPPTAATTAANAANFGIISQFFQSIGITDPSALTWAQGLLTSGAGVAQVEVQMYDQPWFQQRFPEIGLAQKNGLPPISPADVINYENTVSQLEQQAGLPQGFIGKDQITQLMGQYNVSTAELTDRVVQGFIPALQELNSTPQLAQVAQNYYGITPGSLAAYYLDPTKALALLQKQFTAAQIGGEAGITGFGGLDRQTAEQLAALGVTQTQAQQGFSTLGHMAQAYNPLPGEQPGTGVSRAEQVAGQFEGNAQAQLAMQLAAQSRQAAFAGSGSFTGDQGGAKGLGPATPNVP